MWLLEITPAKAFFRIRKINSVVQIQETIFPVPATIVERLFRIFRPARHERGRQNLTL